MDTFEIIDAFVDRERVDPRSLEAALALEEGRAYLVDLLAMRELMSDQVDAIISTSAPPPRRGSFSWRQVLLTAAAALVLASGTYQWGAHRAARGAAGAAPDVPRASTPSIAVRPLDAAPEPTSVIYLEPGVDWHQLVAN